MSGKLQKPPNPQLNHASGGTSHNGGRNGNLSGNMKSGGEIEALKEKTSMFNNRPFPINGNSEIRNVSSS